MEQQNNILVTGAAGYIGGTVLATLLRSPRAQIKASKLWAAVRTTEQAEALSSLDAQVLQVDLQDERAVARAVVNNNINIVVHTASMDLPPASNLIKALGQVRESTGKEVAYVHPYVASMFSPEGGWPHGEVKDTDPLFEMQKKLGSDIPVRAASTGVIELGKDLRVKTYTIPLTPLYGRGLGPVKKLSLPIPFQVRAAVRSGRVYKFEKKGVPPTTHVEDLASLYALLVENIIQGDPAPPEGEKGFYFPVAHRWDYWAVLEGIASSLHSRGLVADPALLQWPDWDVAAEKLALPRAYIEPMMMSGGDLIPVNAYRLGWRPRWADEKAFLGSIDAEVQDALDLDTFKQTAYDSLMKESGSS